MVEVESWNVLWSRWLRTGMGMWRKEISWILEECTLILDQIFVIDIYHWIVRSSHEFTISVLLWNIPTRHYDVDIEAKCSLASRPVFIISALCHQDLGTSRDKTIMFSIMHAHRQCPRCWSERVSDVTWLTFDAMVLGNKYSTIEVFPDDASLGHSSCIWIYMTLNTLIVGFASSWIESHLLWPYE